MCSIPAVLPRTCRSMPLHDLQRDHPLTADALRSLQTDREAERQHGLIPMQHAEAKIGLRAEAAVILARRFARVREKRRAEDGRTQPIQIEARRTGRLEYDRRQIPLDHLADKASRAQLIDVEAGQRVVLAIALHVAVVDIIVPERAEIKARNGIAAVAARNAGRIAQPYR